MTTVQLDFPQLLKWILGVIPYLKYIYFYHASQVYHD